MEAFFLIFMMCSIFILIYTMIMERDSNVIDDRCYVCRRGHEDEHGFCDNCGLPIRDMGNTP